MIPGPARSFVLFAALGLALVACSGDGDVRDAGGTVVAAGSWPVLDLRVGDCLAPEPGETGEVSEVAVVPCDHPHSQEVFATVEHPSGPYPGAHAVSLWADGACLGALEESLGLTLDDGVFVSYLLPTFDGWNRIDDRRATCVLVFPGREAVGSVVAGTAEVSRAATGGVGDGPDATEGGS